MPHKTHYNDAQRVKLDSQILKVKGRLVLGDSRKRNARDDDGDGSGGVPKRRRLSADKQLATAAGATDVGPRRQTRGQLDENAVMS